MKDRSNSNIYLRNTKY